MVKCSMSCLLAIMFASFTVEMALVTEEERQMNENATKRTRCNLLKKAVLWRDTHNVAHELQQGADPNKTSGKFDLTLLCVAVINRDYETASLLLEKGAKHDFTHPPAEDKLFQPPDRMPLCIASSNGDVSMARLLVSHGADVNVKDFRKETPLYHAVRANDPYMVRSLLDMGAKVNVENAYGRSPLQEAQDRCPEVVRLLEDLATFPAVERSEADSN